MSFSSSMNDYVTLCKPRVVALMALTAIVAMFLAAPDGKVPINILFFASVGIILVACSGAAFNHLIDARIDKIMARTKGRPLPTGRVQANDVFIFGVCLAISGLAILIILVNTLTAVLSFFTLIGYAGVYTLYLKRATPQNIVIGGLAGAMPPLLGWTAVSGNIDAGGLLLVLIIFLWTPPHFWALAIDREKEYAKADIPMLPVTHGIKYTKISIILYTLLLVAATYLPFVINMSGFLYLIGLTFLNMGFLYYVIQLYLNKIPKIAYATFRYSIIYLGLLFILLLIDHYWLIFI